MTANVIDLARVRAALARLDVLAREHPHLTRTGSRARLDRYARALDTPEPLENRPADKPDAMR